jgi:hypothetical protein
MDVDWFNGFFYEVIKISWIILFNMFHMVVVVEIVVVIWVASSGAGDDSNTNDDDDDNNEYDDDEEGDLFWLKEFYRRKLVLCTTKALDMFYNNYIYREPCIVSYNTGMRWLNEILNGHWICCVNKFRMDASTFQNLCFDLET